MGRGGSGNWRTKGSVRKPPGKGTRLIILHAGSCKGWINGAEMVFQSKKSGYYHDEMTSENFLKSGLTIP